ncbi:MAG: hypothetical protein QWI36_00600 [Wolbachia endosymbiont of Tyrophagus putrescentiae]|nr:hypothetical protein [Wolbachia endosymbiont of Tyrophagus putrescentiae]
MEYNLSPPNTLQERVLIAMAINLWTKSPVKDEVLRLFKSRSRSICDDGWEKVEKILRKKVVPKALSLPRSLAEELSGISTQIRLEILAWAKYYSRYYCELDFFNNMCWTPQGTVDAEKTARNLVSDQSVHIVKRYRIACINCFEDVIRNLWNSDREFFDEQYLREVKRHTNKLIAFWSYYINQKIDEIVTNGSVYEHGFNVAVEQGNSVAVRYFWPKLTLEEKERNLERCIKIAAEESFTGVMGHFKFPHSCYTNIVCFLLNQMSEKQQKNIFSDVGEGILYGLLNFPYQKLFIATAERMLHTLSRRNRYFLLLYTAKKIANYPQGYRSILKHVWQQVLDTELQGNIWEAVRILSDLYETKDHISIQWVLNSISDSEREACIFSYEGEGICCYLIDQGEWSAISNFIKSCLTRKDLAIKFKKDEKISHYFLENEFPKKAEKFTQLIDDHIASFKAAQERKIEDECYSVTTEEAKANQGKEREDECYNVTTEEAKANQGKKREIEDECYSITAKKVKANQGKKREIEDECYSVTAKKAKANQGKEIEDEDNDISEKKISTDLEVKKVYPINILGRVC